MQMEKPHNPTGLMLSRNDLDFISSLLDQYPNCDLSSIFFSSTLLSYLLLLLLIIILFIVYYYYSKKG